MGGKIVKEGHRRKKKGPVYQRAQRDGRWAHKESKETSKELEKVESSE